MAPHQGVSYPRENGVRSSGCGRAEVSYAAIGRELSIKTGRLYEKSGITAKKRERVNHHQDPAVR